VSTPTQTAKFVPTKPGEAHVFINDFTPANTQKQNTHGRLVTIINLHQSNREAAQIIFSDIQNSYYQTEENIKSLLPKVLKLTQAEHKDIDIALAVIIDNTLFISALPGFSCLLQRNDKIAQILPPTGADFVSGALESGDQILISTAEFLKEVSIKSPQNFKTISQNFQKAALYLGQ